MHKVYTATKYIRLERSRDPLPGQQQDPPRPIVVDNDDQWEVDDILDSRRYYGRLQYKVKWHGIDRDNEWYYADKNEFGSSREVLDEFHRLYPGKPH